MDTKKIFIILLCASVCAAGFTDIFTNPMSIARSIKERIFNNPIVSETARVASNTVADISNFVSNVPISIARYFHDIDIPKFPARRSLTKFIHEFTSGQNNEDVYLSITDLVNKYGFTMEIHRVVTEDGYVLMLYRIPSASNGPPVFLMHGLLGSADDYVIAGPESGLAYLLARQGYDVWLGNARGNKYSRRNLHLDPSESEFWDFSWHEIGYYDLPAMIDYILSKSMYTTLKYIGHSQGTTCFFVMTSERPEYNQKVSLMIALSPVAFMGHMKSPIIRMLVPTQTILEFATEALGIYEFMPNSKLVKKFKTALCGTVPLSDIVCNNVLFLICGFDFAQLNVTNLPVIYNHIPSGASLKQFRHYGQEILSGEFRQFDYGKVDNLIRYGSVVPPNYDLSKITVPISLFYSDNDWMAATSDIEKFATKLNNLVDLYKVPFTPFNHLDFIWAKDFKRLIFNKISELFTRFED